MLPLHNHCQVVSQAFRGRRDVLGKVINVRQSTFLGGRNMVNGMVVEKKLWMRLRLRNNHVF